MPPTWIELDLKAAARNCAGIICDTGTALMAVVKGDAYGHGAVQVGQAALAGGASWLGVFAEEAVAFAREAALAGLHLDGMFSHLAIAEQSHPLNELQLRRFRMAVQAMEEAALRPRWVHLANSAAAFHLPESRHDLVRCANVVLGIRIRIDQPLDPKYRPVLGQLCLDQLMVRLPRPFPEGEEVVVIGTQGGEAIGFHDLAALYGTTQVDIATHLHPRVPRII
jgi:alanine racemase